MEKLFISNKYRFSHWFWVNGSIVTNKIIIDSLTNLNFIIKVNNLNWMYKSNF